MPVEPGDETAVQTATPRQWARLVLVYALIPLVLLLCGGSTGWWQAWLYSLLILVAGVGGRIWAERNHPGLMAARQNIDNFQDAKTWDKILAPLMAISIGFPVVIVAGLDYRHGWSPAFPAWLVGLGFTLIVTGYAFAAWALAENRFFFSVVRVRPDQGHRVCDTGPYRIVRHPGYTGSIVSVFGTMLALGSVWALIPSMVALIITVTRTELEDRALQDELPGYRDYTARVRFRLFPGIY